MDVSINRTADFRELTISYGAGTPDGETIIGGIARADVLFRGTAHEWFVWHASIGEISDNMFPDSTSAINAARAWFAGRALCKTCRKDQATDLMSNGYCTHCCATGRAWSATDTVTDAITGTYADALEYGDALPFDFHAAHADSARYPW